MHFIIFSISLHIDIINNYTVYEKKILVFILVTTTFLSVYANKEHSQDIIIKNIDYNTRDNKSFIRFEIDVTKGNTYYMGVWMIPSKLITTFVDN